MPDACISRALPSSRVGLVDPSLHALTGDRRETRNLEFQLALGGTA